MFKTALILDAREGYESAKNDKADIIFQLPVQFSRSAANPCGSRRIGKIETQIQYTLSLCQGLVFMARKPLRECRVNGCHNLTRNGYCDKHLNLKNERHRIYDTTARDKKAAAFYKSDEWKRARKLALARCFGICQDCGGMAEMVHHIKPLREYPELALVQSNLKPLCNKCHAKY